MDVITMTLPFSVCEYTCLLLTAHSIVLKDMDVITMTLPFSVCKQTHSLPLDPPIHRFVDRPFPHHAMMHLPRDCTIECALADAHKPARVNVAENDAASSKAAGSVGVTEDGPYSTSHRQVVGIAIYGEDADASLPLICICVLIMSNG